MSKLSFSDALKMSQSNSWSLDAAPKLNPKTVLSPSRQTNDRRERDETGQPNAQPGDQASAARGVGMEEALECRPAVSVKGGKPFLNLSDGASSCSDPPNSYKEHVQFLEEVRLKMTVLVKAVRTPEHDLHVYLTAQRLG